MAIYLLKRVLLVIPTMLGILLLNFIIIQAAPGGPVEQTLANLQGIGNSVQNRMGDSSDGLAPPTTPNGDAKGSDYRGSIGLDQELVERIKKQYGFDKPAHERFLLMLYNYVSFNFGESFFRDRSVIDLILEKIPVSVSLGLWSTLIIYLISIPLGIRKAVRDGSRFDVWTSSLIFIGYAIPGFLFAIMLIVLFAGGSYWDIFPLRGLVSDNFDELSLIGKVLDYFWHIFLPTCAIVISGFATLTMLTKNSFLDEINKQYVLTARAKGLTERKVLYGHVFRNAMLIVIAGMPSVLVGVFFTGTFLIEVIFSLDGLGLLGFEAALTRDYPVMFGTLYILTLITLLVNILSDLTYVLVDPRIDFDSREVN